MSKIKLGEQVKDCITGFTGVVVARTEWLYGCVRLGVQSESLDDKGKVRDAIWFDEPQLKVIKKQKFQAPNGSLVTGGPARESDPGH